MRRALSFVLTFILIAASVVMAQVPQAFHHQMVVRDGSDRLVRNTTIGMRFTIQSHNGGSPLVFYCETQTAPTNSNGFITVAVGNGTVQTGVFADIPWGTYNDMELKTEVDPTGGTSYSLSVTQPLQAVPYAFMSNEQQNLLNVVNIGNRAGNNQLKSVKDPSESQDVVTKRYLDSVIAELVRRNNSLTRDTAACVTPTSLPFVWRGSDRNSAGTYRYTIAAAGAGGLDSVIILTLTVSNGTHLVATETACDNYDWHGNNYTSTGNHTYAYTDGSGCPSVDTLKLTILPAVTLAATNLTQTLCQGTPITNIVITNTNSTISVSGLPAGVAYNSVSGQIEGTPSVAGIFNFTITATSDNAPTCANQTENGTITVKPVSVGDTSANECDHFVWYGNNYNSDATPTHVFTAADGCDSTVTLHLTINPSTSVDTNATACGSFAWRGITYNATPLTAPTATTTKANGCDSVVTLHLTVKPVSAYTENLTACDSLWWHGVKYTSAQTDGSVTYTSTAGAANGCDSNGCDSITTLNLTAVYTTDHTAYHNTVDVNYTWGTDPATNGGYGHGNGNTYDSDGKYVGSSYTDAHGCTAYDTLYLTVTGATCEPTAGIDEQNICGSSFDWIDGNTYTENTTSATYTLTNSCGEDSVVTLHLTLNLAAAITSVTGGNLDQEATTTTAITPITFAFANATLSATGLPDGVTLNTTTGVLSGTATEAGSFDYTITATSTYGCSDDSRSGTLTIYDCNGSDENFEGRGTQQCPFLIPNYTKLRLMATLVNAGNATYNATTVYYKQTDDIDVAEATADTNNWNTSTYPGIGSTSANSYKAHYDGDNHTISGLNHDTYGSNPEGPEGLFTYIGGGSVKNLTVSGRFYSRKFHTYIGGVAGKVEDNETFQNVTNNISITVYGKGSSDSERSQTNYGVGGLAAYISNGTTTITNCTNNAKINQPTTISRGGSSVSQDCKNYNMGGFVGNNTGTLIISNSTNSGEISTMLASTACGRIGGFIGSTSGTVSITNSSNSGSVLSNHNSTQIRYSGGIVGYAENTSTIAITNCTNSGTINQNASASSSRCGGIVGGMSAITAGEISNCQNNGTISCTGGIAGGILGYVMTNTSVVTVSNSKNSGSINGSNCGGIVGQVANAAANGINILNDTNTSTITCVSTSGGIVGKIANNVAKIKHCINIGDIVATGNIIGGISGQFDYVNIYGCKNSGNISGPASATKYGGIVGSCGQGFIDSCINTGNLNGGSSSTDASMGGIVGYLANTNDSPTYITNCGNFGNITCKSKAGGIIGYANGKYMHIVNCYNQGNFTISGTYAGGLVGFLYITVSNIYIKNCYSTGLFSSSSNTFAPLINPNGYTGKVSTTASYAINTAATNATYTGTNCNPTTTFDGTTGVLTAPQTIDGSSRTTLQSAVSAWQSANTPYSTASIPLSTWTTETLPRLTWE